MTDPRIQAAEDAVIDAKRHLRDVRTYLNTEAQDRLLMMGVESRRKFRAAHPLTCEQKVVFTAYIADLAMAWAGTAPHPIRLGLGLVEELLGDR